MLISDDGSALALGKAVGPEQTLIFLRVESGVSVVVGTRLRVAEGFETSLFLVGF